MRGSSSPLSLVIVIFAISWLLSGVFGKKAKQQREAQARKRAAQLEAQRQQESALARQRDLNLAQEAAKPAPPPPPAPVRRPYMGSLNTDTLEGVDPCHEDQMKAMPRPALSEEPSEGAEGGLELSWTSSDVVKGFIYSEVLNRRRNA